MNILGPQNPMTLFIHKPKTDDTFTLVFNVNDRTYYLEFNPKSTSMEITSKTKGELYVSFFNILSFCSVNVIYTLEDPCEMESFFRELALEANHHEWPFDQHRGIYKFIQVDESKFIEFKSDKVLMPNDIADDADSGYAWKQCVIMHFMILVDEMALYVAHITNTENNN